MGAGEGTGLGCGTGILSMFAAKSGASRVLAVEGSIRVVKAAEVVKKNKLDLEFFVLKSDTLVGADYVFDEICDFKYCFQIIKVL